jgi:FPC/CPF motif-containing protein YcgG
VTIDSVMTISPTRSLNASSFCRFTLIRDCLTGPFDFCCAAGAEAFLSSAFGTGVGAAAGAGAATGAGAGAGAGSSATASASAASA